MPKPIEIDLRTNPSANMFISRTLNAEREAAAKSSRRRQAFFGSVAELMKAERRK